MSVSRRVMVSALSAVLAFGSIAVVEQAASAKPVRTVKKIVRPVHRDGTPVRGFRVVETRYGDEYYNCWGQSPVSVSPGVDWCGGTADSTIACWPSSYSSVLCLQDPRRRALIRVYYSGSFTRAKAYKRPSPLGLTLTHRRSCSIRLGGAWSSPKKRPNWVGYYGCSGTRDSYAAVYGPRNRRDGIVRSGKAWRVNVLVTTGSKEKFRTERVRVAYYVGTAR